MVRPRPPAISLILVAVFGCGSNSVSPDAGALVPDASVTVGNSNPGPATCPTSPASDPLSVATDRGWLHGAQVGATRAYLGVPFAKPPVGNLRWKQPVLPDCFSSVREASAYGNMCVQKGSGGTVLGAEDCLYLNVWTPASSANAKLPVLFFIHGGAEVAGSANASISGGGNLYDGEKLATKSPAIVVSTNYRLGPLGFLAHPALGTENGGLSGNYAIYDLLAALRWVQTNIEAFGGDKSRVMIFGESAGALNTCTLVASPLAKGLFSSALMESGGCDAPTLKEREADGIGLAAKQGCIGGDAAAAACLRNTPAGSLMPDVLGDVSIFNSKNTDLSRKTWYLGWGPAVDGTVLRYDPLTTIRKGEHNHVPFAVGTNAHETELFLPAIVNTCADYWADVTAQFGSEIAKRIFALYPCLSYPFPRYAMVDWSTDLVFTCPARRIARALAKTQGEPAYRYLFTHVSSGSTALLRAFHTAELPFVFGTFGTWTKSAPTAGEENLIATMQGYWGRMALGDPNGGGALAWPKYDVSNEPLLVLDEKVSIQTQWKNDKCDLWDSLTDL